MGRCGKEQEQRSKRRTRGLRKGGALKDQRMHSVVSFFNIFVLLGFAHVVASFQMTRANLVRRPITHVPLQRGQQPHRLRSVAFASNDGGDDGKSDPTKYFVPGFFVVWAVGYGAIAYTETSTGGLGDVGGYISAGFAVVLLVALLGAAVYEIVNFEDPSESKQVNKDPFKFDDK